MKFEKNDSCLESELEKTLIASKETNKNENKSPKTLNETASTNATNDDRSSGKKHRKRRNKLKKPKLKYTPKLTASEEKPLRVLKTEATKEALSKTSPVIDSLVKKPEKPRKASPVEKQIDQKLKIIDVAPLLPASKAVEPKKPKHRLHKRSDKPFKSIDGPSIAFKPKILIPHRYFVESSKTFAQVLSKQDYDLKQENKKESSKTDNVTHSIPIPLETEKTVEVVKETKPKTASSNEVPSPVNTEIELKLGEHAPPFKPAEKSLNNNMPIPEETKAPSSNPFHTTEAVDMELYLYRFYLHCVPYPLLDTFPIPCLIHLVSRERLEQGLSALIYLGKCVTGAASLHTADASIILSDQIIEGMQVTDLETYHTWLIQLIRPFLPYVNFLKTIPAS